MFLSPEFGLVFCKPGVGAPRCYLDKLEKLQKRLCRTVGPSLDVSRELLAPRRNLASLSLFYKCYFSRCSSELTELVPFSDSCVR